MKKHILLILFVLHLILLAGTRFTAWPEMMLWPYLVLKGWLPYRDIAIAHNPLLILDLAAFNWIFGIGVWQLKVYTWILILLTDGILFWVAKRLWNSKVALAALAVYIPLQIFFEGNGLWFDLALAPLALLLFYFLYTKDYLWAGVVWALAFLTKQTAVWFLLPIFATILASQGVYTWKYFSSDALRGWFKSIKPLLGGMGIIFAAFLLIVLAFGLIQDYWFWAYRFGIGFLPQAQGQVQLPLTRQLVVVLAAFLIVLPGLLTKKSKTYSLLAIWAVFASMGTFPRWEMFHFQPGIVFVALAAGLLIADLKKHTSLVKSVIILWLAANLILVARGIGRQWGGQDRFIEKDILAVSEYISQNTHPSDKIYLLNTWDNIYALSDRTPATSPWVPYLSWYIEYESVEEELIFDLENTQAGMIIVRPFTDEGLSSYQPEKIISTISQNYELVDNVNSHLIYIPKQ